MKTFFYNVVLVERRENRWKFSARILINSYHILKTKYLICALYGTPTIQKSTKERLTQYGTQINLISISMLVENLTTRPRTKRQSPACLYNVIETCNVVGFEFKDLIFSRQIT